MLGSITTIGLKILLILLLNDLQVSTQNHYYIPTYNEANLYQKCWNKDHAICYFNMTFTHAESPSWDPDTSTLYWVDVLVQQVHSLNYKTFEHRSKYLDCGEVNVVLLVANSDDLLIGCQDKIFILTWNTGQLKQIAHLDSHTPANIFNEGRCDARGRLWAGTKGPQRHDDVQRSSGSLYKVERPYFYPEKILMHVTISNGVVWSLNNSIMYYIDSGTNRIDAFEYDLERGRLGNWRTIIDTKDWGFVNAVPDGATIDRDGFLWVALYSYGQVIRVDPDARRIVSVYDLPVPRATSVAWVGDTLENLAVTTSRRNLPYETIRRAPLAGKIFFLKNLGTGGVKENKFAYRS